VGKKERMPPAAHNEISGSTDRSSTEYRQQIAVIHLGKKKQSPRYTVVSAPIVYSFFDLP
jgi:hypothetical protein